MVGRRLRIQFARLLAAVLAAASVGCSGGSPPSGSGAGAPPRPRRSSVACRPDDYRPVLLAGVTTAVPLDAIEIRRGRAPGEAGELIEARGDFCGGMGKDECDAARRRAAPDEGFLVRCAPSTCFHYLLLRRGDRIAAARRLDDVRRVLAPIDTEHDALLLAWASEIHVGCKDGALDGEIERTGAGFRYTVEAMTSSCPPVTSRIVVDIGRDGAVTEVARQKLREDPGCILE